MAAEHGMGASPAARGPDGAGPQTGYFDFSNNEPGEMLPDIFGVSEEGVYMAWGELDGILPHDYAAAMADQLSACAYAAKLLGKR
jgi:hypothetical protein